MDIGHTLFSYNKSRDEWMASTAPMSVASTCYVGRSLSPALGRLPINAMLDSVNASVLLIDTKSLLHFYNGAARLLLQRASPIAKTVNRLVFTERMVSETLDRFLNHSEARHTAGGPLTSLTLRLDDRAGQSVRFAVVSPLLIEPETGNSGVALLFVVTIFEPLAERFISTSVLRGLYGLTAAESGVAQRLYSGRRLEQLCAELGVSLNTVRTHLKRVFEKCGVRSQAELLQLLALGPKAA